MARKGTRFAPPPQPSAEDARLQLEELRASTKAALLESWQEVEVLQMEKQEYQERTMFLHSELESSKERETELRDMITKLQRQKTTNKAPRGAPLSKLFVRSKSENVVSDENKSVASSTCRSVSSFKTDPSTCSSRIDRRRSSDSSGLRRATFEKIDLDHQRKMPSRNNSKIWWNTNNAKPQNEFQEERELMENELLLQMTELEREKNKLIAEWQVRVRCRDSALENLEKTNTLQTKTVNLLRMELDEVKSRSAKMEEQMTKEMKRLREKLNDRKQIIQKQASRLEACQQYIAELTEELEKVARVSPASAEALVEPQKPKTRGGARLKLVTPSPRRAPLPPVEVSFTGKDHTPAA